MDAKKSTLPKERERKLDSPGSRDFNSPHLTSVQIHGHPDSTPSSSSPPLPLLDATPVTMQEPEPSLSLTSSSSSSSSRSSRSSPSVQLSPACTPLGPRDFTLLRQLGSGDLSTVYLCRDADHRRFAMKVVDQRQATRKNKQGRFETELRVLRLLHHPFLPSLHATFEASPHHSCAVIDFCPAGDLHSLRHRQPSRRFPTASARFYAAEVLAALEYLHLLGVVYRDLKPENVLLRSDGHIMLSDFDLALVSTTFPEVEEKEPSPNSCWGRSKSNRRPRCRRVVAEPVEARSASFVGTHEYVAPEVAGGGTHGAEVDWWALGVLLYELIFGRTPFVGATNEATLRNIVKSPLAFPDGCRVETPARDLIARLLEKDPTRRLGSRGGAADVKAHPFFRGVNFALLRSEAPPVDLSGTRKEEKSFECF